MKSHVTLLRVAIVREQVGGRSPYIGNCFLVALHLLIHLPFSDVVLHLLRVAECHRNKKKNHIQTSERSRALHAELFLGLT